LKEALIENINSGGDSSARGILAGAVIATYSGLDSMDKKWPFLEAVCGCE
jgi:ADP-ribosylglycohydrolase